METGIIVIHVAAAVILVLTVLLQAGKGAGMGAAFGGSSSSVFGARGPATLISKITCAAAIIFMCTSLSMTVFQRNLAGQDSIMEKLPVPAAASPAAPAEASPAAPAAEAATPENSAN